MRKHTLLVTAAVLALAGSAHATPLGLNTDPGSSGWNRGDANSAYAVFDNYSAFSFSNVTTGFATGGFATISWGQATTLSGNPGIDQGAGVYTNVSDNTPGTDVLYAGNRPPVFSIDGATSFTAYGVAIQVKRAMSTVSLSGELVITLNGLTPDSFQTVPALEIRPPLPAPGR